MASAKTRPAKHYIEEWERHPDLFVFEPTCVSPHNAAQAVIRWCAFHFEFPVPYLSTQNRVTGPCTCTGYPGRPDAVCAITLREGFPLGELLHELAHAYCFNRYVEHDHGLEFTQAMDEICFWFRLDEKAQAAFFP